MYIEGKENLNWGLTADTILKCILLRGRIILTRYTLHRHYSKVYIIEGKENLNWVHPTQTLFYKCIFLVQCYIIS